MIFRPRSGSWVYLLLWMGRALWADSTAPASCENELAPKLSSMVYYWVNASGSKIDPATASYLKKITPGGVLISAGNGRTLDQFSDLVSSIRKIYEDKQAPTPFIGADFLRLKEHNTPRDLARVPGQDLGFGTRITDVWQPEMDALYDDVRKVCLQTSTEVKALLHRIVGINHPLGPQIEEKILPNGVRNPQTQAYPNLADLLQEHGVVPTIKHYPFTIEGMDGHKTTLSPPISEPDLQALEKNFFGSKQGNYVVMTTHVGAEGVDQGRLVTFSKPWIDRLRGQIGEKNLIMTDGLFMIGAYPEHLSSMSGLSAEEIATYFKGNEYDSHSPPMFPWRYAVDPTFQAVKPVLKKYNALGLTTTSSLSDALSQDTEAQARWKKQQKLYQDFHAELIETLSRKKGYQYKTKTEQIQGAPYTTYVSSDRKANEAFNRAMRYGSLLNGKFDPDRAQEVSGQVIASFAEKAILAGHDLLVIEGNPIDQIYSKILKRACGENPELRGKIEAASSRIAAFKEGSKKELNHRASKEWIETNRGAIEFLAFDLFPRLNDPRKACSQEDLAATRSEIQCLSQGL